MSSTSRPPAAAFDWALANLHWGENLPHVVQRNAIYFVTFRLHDSVPLSMLRQWRCELAHWERNNPPPRTSQQEQAYADLGYRRIERWLDRHTGSCVLESPRCHDAIEACLRKCDGERLWLGDYIIMPNHLHALLQPAQDEELDTILKAWYAVTTRAINRITGRQGRLWQEEPFDHVVRNESSLCRIRKYIQENGQGLDARRWRYGCGKLFENQ